MDPQMEAKPTELVPVNTEPSRSLLRPQVAPGDLIAYHEEVTDLIGKALKAGKDYGKVPGVDKPTLLKPGAERLALCYGLRFDLSVVEREIQHEQKFHWTKRKKEWYGPQNNRKFRYLVVEGDSVGLYRYVVKCDVFHQRSGQIVTSCLGACSTMESKYIDRPSDCENTVLKMAQKRALVGATLLALGLSDRFTQDMEDHDPPEPEEPVDNTPQGSTQNQVEKTKPGFNNDSKTPSSSPVTKIFITAINKGIPKEIFSSKLTELGITKDPVTWDSSPLAALATWVDNWSETTPPENPPTTPVIEGPRPSTMEAIRDLGKRAMGIDTDVELVNVCRALSGNYAPKRLDQFSDVDLGRAFEKMGQMRR